MTQEEIKCCANCKHFYYLAAQMGHPYPEFTCTKGIWDGVSCKEDIDSLHQITECEHYNPQTQPPTPMTQTIEDKIRAIIDDAMVEYVVISNTYSKGQITKEQILDKSVEKIIKLLKK